MTIRARPGESFEASVEGAPTGLVGTIGVQVINPPAGTVMVARTTAGIVEQPAGLGIYHTTLTAPTALDAYSVVWDTGGVSPQPASEDLVVSGFAYPTSTFATVADVQAKCGGDHTDEQIEYMLDAATAAILGVADKDLDWLADVDTVVPSFLRYLAVDLVCRSFSNPGGSSATREQLGEYSYSQSFSTDSAGMWLTVGEERAVRMAVWGTLAASARTDSIAFDAEPW